MANILERKVILRLTLPLVGLEPTTPAYWPDSASWSYKGMGVDIIQKTH